MEYEELIAAVRDLKKTIIACALAQSYYETMRLTPVEDLTKGLPREATERLQLIRRIEESLESHLSQ